MLLLPVHCLMTDRGSESAYLRTWMLISRYIRVHLLIWIIVGTVVVEFQKGVAACRGDYVSETFWPNVIPLIRITCIRLWIVWLLQRRSWLCSIANAYSSILMGTYLVNAWLSNQSCDRRGLWQHWLLFRAIQFVRLRWWYRILFFKLRIYRLPCSIPYAIVIVLLRSLIVRYWPCCRIYLSLKVLLRNDLVWAFHNYIQLLYS